MAKKKNKIDFLEIKNKEVVDIIYNSDMPLKTLAKETNYSIEEINILLEEYHNSLDLRMEQFKEEISKLKVDSLEAIDELKLLEQQIPKIDYSKLEPKKSYCEVCIGGKWVDNPLEKLGSKSFIKILK